MQIVNRAADYTSDDPVLNPPINESQTNPMRRDTVLMPAGSSATFRVIADNPGVWFFHCACSSVPRVHPVLTCSSLSAAGQVTSSGTWKSASRSSSLRRPLWRRSATRCRRS